MARSPETSLRRAFGIADDAGLGGSCYDDLTAGEVPDADTWYPVTSGQVDKGVTRINRDDEVRAVRAGFSEVSFQASPTMTFTVPCYRTVAAKLLKKAFGKADSRAGTPPASIIHTLEPLEFGESPYATPMHVQLIRDALNHKMSGGQVQSLTFNFPIGGEATIDVEVHGLYLQEDRGEQPVVAFTGLSSDPFALRDGKLLISAGSTADEVQTLTTTGSPTGGTFRLTFRGAATANIAYNAAASVVQAALELLPTIGTAGVTCAGGALPTGVTITFDGTDLADTDVPLIGLDDALTGGSSPTTVIVETTKGVGTGQEIDLQGFSITWNNALTVKHYPSLNIETNTVDIPAQERLWWPGQRKLGSRPTCTVNFSVGSVDQLMELRQRYSVVERMDFEVLGDDLGTTPDVPEKLVFKCYANQLIGGGADPLVLDGDIQSSYDGRLGYSVGDAKFVTAEITDDDNTDIT